MKKIKIVPTHDIFPVVGKFKNLFLSINTSAVHIENQKKGCRLVIYDLELAEQVYEYFFIGSSDLTPHVCPKGEKI